MGDLVSQASKRLTHRQCSGIVKSTGKRCSNWAVHGEDLCAGHSGRTLKRAQDAAKRSFQERAEARKQARLSVRERAAKALDEDWEDVLKALRRGIKSEKSAEASRTAIAYVQLVYGRQLQQSSDETTQGADPLDVSVMSRDERDALKRRILSQHPHLVRDLKGDGEDIGEPGA